MSTANAGRQKNHAPWNLNEQ